MMNQSSALSAMFGLTYPIIQAPMAGASGGDLAREVARAGGLGFIGTGTRATPAWLVGEWAKLEGARPVGIGFMTWALDRYPDQRELLQVACKLHPAAVLISFGDPRPYGPAIKAAGARLICQVQTAADVPFALEAGADLLVAQGAEAGGHTGEIPLRSILAEVLAAAGEVPVAAAGGIATGADVAAVMAAGACGGMIGTRFVATSECLYHARAKERIVQAGEGETVYTSVFDRVQGIPWPSQFRGRALRNDFTDRWHGHEAELTASVDAVRPVFEAARQAADYRTMYVYAGEAAARIDAILTAAEVVRRIGEGLV
jgi:nitronate monooxygenase